MAHPHEDLARRAYEAFAQGDMQTMGELLADDAQWHVTGTGPLDGTYDGKEATFGLFRELGERSGGTFSLDLHGIVANDDHTVAIIRASGSRGGKQIDDNGVHVMHIEDDRITSFWSLTSDQAAQAEFWE